jgi:ribonuclease HI
MGIGIYIETSEEKFEYRIDKKNAIMNGELLGILQAIKLTKNRNQDIVIFSDSKSSLQLLIKSFHQHTDNCHVEKILSFIMEKIKHKIKIQWVPSHVGINGNEIADELAKNGTTSSWYLTNNFTIKETTLQMKQQIFKEWEKEYQEISKKKGKGYFEIEKSPRQKPWFQNYRGSSHEIKLLTRIRTDHYLSNKKLKLFKQKQTENCEICKEVDDINHILFKCKKYENLRKKVNIIKNTNNVNDLIKNKNYLNYKALYQFLKLAEINL